MPDGKYCLIARQNLNNNCLYDNIKNHKVLQVPSLTLEQILHTCMTFTYFQVKNTVIVKSSPCHTINTPDFNPFHSYKYHSEQCSTGHNKRLCTIL